MKVYRGKSVFGGIAIGRIQVYGKTEKQVKYVKIEDSEAEAARYREATEVAKAQLGTLYEKALREVGEADAAIFEIHRMMLEDGEYQGSVEHIIRAQKGNAEYAVAQTAGYFARKFAAMEDSYMRGRTADVKDISERLLSILRQERQGIATAEPVILVAEELTPSETVQLDRERVLSFVTAGGSLHSHTAVLARAMGLPSLVGTAFPTAFPMEESVDGKLGIVDGDSGVFYVDPDEETLWRMREAQREGQVKKERLQTLKGKENITLDGQKIMLYANIGNRKDVEMALENDAEGIGLFRSEFLCLGREGYPTEEEQFRIYRAVAEAMGGKRVVIRTFDIGADKQCACFGVRKEENPALGCRAIRLCLAMPEVFKAQIKAILRASMYGNIAILYPMITSVGEVRRIRQIVEEGKAELDDRGIAYGNPEQGIMIETPAAALISDLLAREADFFSIGTNDLTQYLLAIDRQNPSLEEFYDPRHPAVLRMVALVTEHAHRAGIRAGICGELGADPELTREFLAMGVDELSVPPERILPLRKIVREISVRKMEENKVEEIKVGFIGLGCRGEDLLRRIVLAQGELVAAVCDTYEDRAEEGAKAVEAAGQARPAVYLDYRDVIKDENVNTIIIATAWESHVEIALEAMYAGKAVAMEVGGAYDLQHCYDLVEAYEKTGAPFMFLENCCFGRREMMVLNMVKKGLFGEVVHCAGGYQHDLRYEISFGKENRHYRLRNYLSRNCDNYPTHDLGPIAKVLDINHGNRMLTLSSTASKAVGLRDYILENKPDDEFLRNRVFAQGDVVTTVIKCARGETIVLTLDTTLPRYYSRNFTVRGTKAMYEEATDSIFLDRKEDRKHDFDWLEHCAGNAKQYAQEYDHPLWKAYIEEGIKGGHDGMDWLEFEIFFRNLREGKPMPVDVYDAASWMAVTALSEMSVSRGGAVVEIPDFTGGKWHMV